MSTKPPLSLETFSELARNTLEGSSIIREYVARHMAALNKNPAHSLS